MSTPFTQMKLKVLFAATVLAVAGGAACASPAEAGVHVGFSIGHNWGHGRWVHDRYHGRLGWWWVVGPRWYYYDRPHTFIVQPAQPVVIQQASPVVVQSAPQPMTPPPPPPPSPVLYYCKATGTHYPETLTCPGGWMTRTAETPPVPTTAQPQDLGPDQSSAKEPE